VFLIQNKIYRRVPPVSFSLSAPGLLVSALPPPGVPRAAPKQPRAPEFSAVRIRQRQSKRRFPLRQKLSPASPPCPSAASPLPVRIRVPPPLFELAVVPAGKRCHHSVRELLQDAPVPTSSTTGATRRSSDPAPVRSSVEPPPPPRALSGEPLLPEMPQSSPPLHRVALAVVPNPPHRWPTPKSGRPSPPLPQMSIPSPASAWAACRRQSCGPRPVVCQRVAPA
jgi:hypothetical protein